MTPPGWPVRFRVAPVATLMAPVLFSVATFTRSPEALIVKLPLLFKAAGDGQCIARRPAARGDGPGVGDRAVDLHRAGVVNVHRSRIRQPPKVALSLPPADLEDPAVGQAAGDVKGVATGTDLTPGVQLPGVVPHCR